MNIAVRHRMMSIEDFLAWEARQELRWEFDGFEPVAMTGGSRNHARIQRNLAISVGGRLRGSRCEFLGSDMKVLLLDRVRYPDGQVMCGGSPGTATFMTTPVVLFEIVSPSSVVIDHMEKSGEYRRLDTVRRYVILEQDRVAATVHVRDSSGGWMSLLLAAEDDLLLPEIGLVMALSELYDGVDFQEG